MKTEFDYIKFSQLVVKNKMKTTTWDCSNKRTGALLGFVKWFSAWRRYTFHAVGETVFDASCLADIAGFLNSLMIERMEKPSFEIRGRNEIRRNA